MVDSLARPMNAACRVTANEMDVEGSRYGRCIGSKRGGSEKYVCVLSTLSAAVNRMSGVAVTGPRNVIHGRWGYSEPSFVAMQGEEELL